MSDRTLCEYDGCPEKATTVIEGAGKQPRLCADHYRKFKAIEEALSINSPDGIKKSMEIARKFIQEEESVEELKATTIEGRIEMLRRNLRRRDEMLVEYEAMIVLLAKNAFEMGRWVNESKRVLILARDQLRKNTATMDIMKRVIDERDGSIREMQSIIAKRGGG